MSGLVHYVSDDQLSRIQPRADGQAVWLTHLEMNEPYASAKHTISLQSTSLFENGEWARISVVNQSLTTVANGKRRQTSNASIRVCREGTIKPFLTVQVAAKSRVTAEESSADQTMVNAWALRRAEVVAHGSVRSRRPLSAGT